MGKRTCMETALAKLNYRMRTEHELRKALSEAGFNNDEIDDSLEELKEYGYIDDLRFVREFYKSYRRKNWSRNRIIRALGEKGITSGMARDALDDFEGSQEFESLGLNSDERTEALKVGRDMARIQLNSGKNIDDNFLRKIGRRLTTLGYDTGCCYFVMKKIREEGNDSLEE